jgi:DNA polymerase III delta prime subunit
MTSLDKLVWAEHYRPRKVADCILPPQVTADVQAAIASDSIPHFLFTGTAGTGKTTLARAIADEVGAELLFINASLNRSIDDIRNTVVQFASTVSFDGSKKIVLLDEVDGLTQQAQDSLRGVYEQFGHIRFILTCNHKNKVIEALRSRSSIIEFKALGADKPIMMKSFFKRVVGILKERGVEYDQAVVAQVIATYFPDFRRTLNELQRYSSSGKIDSGILASTSKENFKVLVDAMKKKDFKACRAWVGQNSDIDASLLYRDLYDNAYSHFEGKNIAQLVLILADYQYKAAFVADPEINTMAAITEIMIECQFKDAT